MRCGNIVVLLAPHLELETRPAPHRTPQPLLPSVPMGWRRGSGRPLTGSRRCPGGAGQGQALRRAIRFEHGSTLTQLDGRFIHDDFEPALCRCSTGLKPRAETLRPPATASAHQAQWPPPSISSSRGRTPVLVTANGSNQLPVTSTGQSPDRFRGRPCRDATQCRSVGDVEDCLLGVDLIVAGRLVEPPALRENRGCWSRLHAGSSPRESPANRHSATR